MAKTGALKQTFNAFGEHFVTNKLCKGSATWLNCFLDPFLFEQGVG